jgi:hypothetical protein
VPEERQPRLICFLIFQIVLHFVARSLRRVRDRIDLEDVSI